MIRELRYRVYCRRYSDDVYRFARSILGNASDAEDATQEVLIKFWQNFSDIQRAKSRAWLLRTTRNYCLDQKKKRRLNYSTLDEHVTETKEDKNIRHPATIMDNQEWRRTIDLALAELPEKQAHVFILYEVNGLRYREIAETLDIPLNSVRAYLSRARKSLQEQLKGHELCQKN